MPKVKIKEINSTTARSPAQTSRDLNPEEEVPNNPPEEIQAEEVEVLEADEIIDHDLNAIIPETESQKEKSLARYDALSTYLREINQYPPLSREEELELSTRYVKDKDLDAAYKLISSNLWLVVKIARDYERAARSLLDLIQEGNIGLMEAVKNFDPFRGVRFPSYAVWWIKAYIIRYLIANWRMVKIGTTQAQRKLFFNLRKEKDKLEREGFAPQPKLLAERLNVREQDVIEMEQRLGQNDASMDAPTQADGESNLFSVIPSSEENAESLLLKQQMQSLIKAGIQEFASTLKEKELIIFNKRMLADEKATLQEISDQLHISRERVRQIENRLREKLKVFMQTQYSSVAENFEE